MGTPDLPAAARTLLKQLAELVPAWSINGPRHATGPCVFGGLSEETDGEGKRTRTQFVEQVDSVLIRAYHADGRAIVALWVRRPGVECKPRSERWKKTLYGGRTRKIKGRIHVLPPLVALLPERATTLFMLDLLGQIAPRSWALDMAWRGRAPHEHAPHELATKNGTASAAQLRAYVAAPDHAAALAAVTPTTENGAAA